MHPFLQEEIDRLYTKFFNTTGEYPLDLEKRQKEAILESYTRVLTKVRELVESKRKKHFIFECNGAYGGKGCYETFCEDTKGHCKSDDAKETRAYNQALDDLLQALEDK